jgi:hypothetical protein
MTPHQHARALGAFAANATCRLDGPRDPFDPGREFVEEGEDAVSPLLKRLARHSGCACCWWRFKAAIVRERCSHREHFIGGRHHSRNNGGGRSGRIDNSGSASPGSC